MEDERGGYLYNDEKTNEARWNNFLAEPRAPVKPYHQPFYNFFTRSNQFLSWGSSSCCSLHPTALWTSLQLPVSLSVMETGSMFKVDIFKFDVTSHQIGSLKKKTYEKARMLSFHWGCYPFKPKNLHFFLLSTFILAWNLPPGTGTNSFVLGIFVEVRRPKKRMPRTKRPFVRPVGRSLLVEGCDGRHEGFH